MAAFINRHDARKLSEYDPKRFNKLRFLKRFIRKETPLMEPTGICGHLFTGSVNTILL